MTNIQCYTWDEADILWNDNPYTWDEVCLVLKIGGGVDESQYLNAVRKLDPEEKKRFIKLYFKVKSQTESDKWFALREMDVLEVEEIENVKVTVAEVKMVIESVRKYINVEV